MITLRILFILSFCGLLIQCSNKSNGNQSVGRNELKEPLIEANIKITQDESRNIDKYIERHEWDMEITGTGLRYMIYEKGPGIIAVEGMMATVEFEINCWMEHSVILQWKKAQRNS